MKTTLALILSVLTTAILIINALSGGLCEIPRPLLIERCQVQRAVDKAIASLDAPKINRIKLSAPYEAPPESPEVYEYKTITSESREVIELWVGIFKKMELSAKKIPETPRTGFNVVITFYQDDKEYTFQGLYGYLVNVSDRVECEITNYNDLSGDVERAIVLTAKKT